MSHNPATLAIIGVVVAVIVIAGALATTGILSPSSSSQSVTTTLPSTSTISNSTQFVTTNTSTQSITLPPPIPAPTHGWINSTYGSKNYSPVIFGAYASDDTSNIGPSVLLGNLTLAAKGNSNGPYETITIPSNTFVGESFLAGQSTFFNMIAIPIAVPVTGGGNITMAVYINGQMVAQGSNNITGWGSPLPSNVTQVYDSNYFDFTQNYLPQNYQVAAGSIVTIGFVANISVGIFPFHNILGNASSITNISSIPSSLYALPNNFSALPVFYAIGLAS